MLQISPIIDIISIIGEIIMNELLAGIGQRISSARKSKKMTQEALAELADVSYQTISSAELGKKALRPENILRSVRHCRFPQITC